MSSIPFPMLVGLGILGLMLLLWLKSKAKGLLNDVRMQLFTLAGFVTSLLHVALVAGGVLLAVQFQVHVMGVDPAQAMSAQRR